MTRKDLKPGTIIRHPFGVWLERAGIGELLVIIDDKTEVGFWRGGNWCIGRLEPNVAVEVVC